MKPSVVLADDHLLMVEGPISLLADKVDFLDEAADGRILVEKAIRRKLDIVIIGYLDARDERDRGGAATGDAAVRNRR